MPDTASSPDLDRAARLSILAQAELPSLAERWAELGVDPALTVLRGPETGLIALRGRMGGGGAPFHFGEATATRATVRLDSGAVGHAVVLGRDATKAKLVAALDALARDAAMAARIDRTIIAPLRAEMETRDGERAAETAATKVDFFTLVRGED